MANERRNLVREMRRALCELPDDEFFLMAKKIEQIDEKEESQVELWDEEGCFDFVSVFFFAVRAQWEGKTRGCLCYLI